jgi:hypothetical protein
MTKITSGDEDEDVWQDDNKRKAANSAAESQAGRRPKANGSLPAPTD